MARVTSAFPLSTYTSAWLHSDFRKRPSPCHVLESHSLSSSELQRKQNSEPVAFVYKKVVFIKLAESIQKDYLEKGIFVLNETR
jgi:hypothetical protein